MKIQIAILLLVVTVSAHIKYSHENAHLYSFSDYELEFERQYTDELEHQVRKTIFETNFEKIRAINADPTNTWKAGVNQFTDQMKSEVNRMKGYNRALRFQNHNPLKSNTINTVLTDLPETVDWRDKGVVSPVRNQGGCGSCWTFSTIAVMESHVAIQTGKLLAMSEQQLVDCAPNPQHCGGTGGCEGATQELGFDYLHKIGGAESRSSYPYTGRDGKCQDSKYPKIATIDGYNQLKINDYDVLMTTVATQGPVAISVAADAWETYSSGIFNGKCGSTIDHAVTAVGYGVENGKNYWIVRNSWGSSWGEKGYIRVHREASAADVKCAVDYKPKDGDGCDGGPTQITVCGLCGILSDSSIPFGGKIPADYEKMFE